MISESISAYLLTKEFLKVLGDMDRLMEKKGKTEDEIIRKDLDDKYDELVEELFRIQHKLKAANIEVEL